MSNNGEKVFYSTISALGGYAGEFCEILESEFASANQSAYIPPEVDVYRRVEIPRTIQLLKNAPLGIKTSQTNIDTKLRMPCGLLISNDALDGRSFIIWNNGTTDLSIEDYSGVLLRVLKPEQRCFLLHSENNIWEVLFNAKDIKFDNSTNGFDNSDVQGSLEEIDFREETKEPTGFVNTRYDSLVDFNETTRTFSIWPVGDSYRYFICGHEYIKTGTDSVIISDLSGLWFVYFVGDTLTASQTPWSFTAEVAFVFTIYWNASTSQAITLNEERHGLTMDWATHRYHHFTKGMDIESLKFTPYNYIIRGDGTLNAHAQIGYTDLGLFFDEDLDYVPINTLTPTNDWEQTIGPYLNCPTLYREGTEGYWKYLAGTPYPMAWQSGNLIRYNHWTGSTWELATCTEGYFVNTYICLIDDPRNPFICFIGNQYLSIADAAGELFKNVVVDFPIKEIYPLSKVIFRTSISYTNEPKAVLFALLPVGEAVVDNDRYTIEVNATGNVGVGKYLDRAGGSSSIDNPFVFPEASFIRYIALQCQSGQAATCTIGIFKTTDLNTPVITISLNNSSYTKLSYSYYFNGDDEICWKIVSGSVNKPYLTTWVQTQLG